MYTGFNQKGDFLVDVQRVKFDLFVKTEKLTFWCIAKKLIQIFILLHKFFIIAYNY